jgi:hypothetical protein
VTEAGRRTKPRLVYAIIAVGGIAVIVAAQLLLSIAVAQGAYEIDSYQVQQASLAREEQKLSEDLDRVQSPQFLAANAEALGMVPNANPVYLRLSDGAVLGEPTAADRRRSGIRTARAECADQRRAARDGTAAGADSERGDTGGGVGRSARRAAGRSAAAQRRPADARHALTRRGRPE